MLFSLGYLLARVSEGQKEEEEDPKASQASCRRAILVQR
jgi:hypothetical protein